MYLFIYIFNYRPHTSDQLSDHPDEHLYEHPLFTNLNSSATTHDNVEPLQHSTMFVTVSVKVLG